MRKKPVTFILSNEVTMDTAKLFIDGRSQVVLLPKSYRFEGKEVFLKKVPGGVLLLPQENSIWDEWENTLSKYDTPFMIQRDQPMDNPQKA